jgi:PAS domain S-box-containing protein
MSSTHLSLESILFSSEHSAELARGVMDALYVFVAVLARDGTLLQVNAAPLKRSGVKLDEVRGKPLWDSLWWNYSSDLQQQLRAACGQAAQGVAARFDAVVRMADERRIAIDFQVAPLRDEAGAVSYLVASASDITERKQAEAALREQDMRKDAFIAALAHELRNPLAPVSNAIEILERLGERDERAVRAQEVIKRQVTHLVALLDDLLDIARIGRGAVQLNVEVCDLCTIAAQTAEDYRCALEAVGCSMHIRTPPVALLVKADPVRLSQMVRNYLQNAQRFAAGAAVAVECSVDEEHRMAVLSVTDTGQGFTTDTASKLFAVYGQAEQSIGRAQAGMGLGLALTKGLALLQGGSVGARSEGLGKGASFKFTLPLVADAPKAAAVPAHAKQVSTRNHVLIVEDQRDTAETLRVLLESHGYRVIVAFDGTTGQAMAEMWHPEIVISDIGLPGMNGYELAETLRRNPAMAQTLLVAVSGYADEASRLRSLAAGFDIHLAKPVPPHQLLESLEKATAGPCPSGDHAEG